MTNDNNPSCIDIRIYIINLCPFYHGTNTRNFYKLLEKGYLPKGTKLTRDRRKAQKYGERVIELDVYYEFLEIDYSTNYFILQEDTKLPRRYNATYWMKYL